MVIISLLIYILLPANPQHRCEEWEGGRNRGVCLWSRLTSVLLCFGRGRSLSEEDGGVKTCWWCRGLITRKAVDHKDRHAHTLGPVQYFVFLCRVFPVSIYPNHAPLKKKSLLCCMCLSCVFWHPSLVRSGQRSTEVLDIVALLHKWMSGCG